MSSYTYIITNRKNGTLYIGVTSNILQRLTQHRNGTYEGFTKKYHVNLLVHLEKYGDIEQAIQREKQLKHWNRPWKIALIETTNPLWKDLSKELGY